MFLLIAEDDADGASAAPEDLLPPPDGSGGNDPDSAQLRLNALSGGGAPRTLSVNDQIHGYKVQILIDGGSFHNIFQEVVAHFLGLEKLPTAALKVLVGNGNELHCNKVCRAVTVIMQGQFFIVDLFILDIREVDIVLGVEWLKGLGPIVTDYESLTMKFIQEGHLVELKGEFEPRPASVSVAQLRRLINTDRAASFFQLVVQSHNPESDNPDLNNLLHHYASLL